MSWKNILKNDSDRKYSDEAFEQIKILLKKLTGEDWDEVFGDREDAGVNSFNLVEEQENSESSKLLNEYYDEHPLEWEHDLYTPHLLRWLKGKLE